MAEKTKSIEDFVKFTCSTETEARTYLENAGWNTEMALLMYFDDRDDRMDATTDHSTPAFIPPAEESATSDDEPTEAEAPEPFTFAATPERSSTGRPAPIRVNRSNIRTFASLRANNDEEDDDQLYYAGGSQSSGQQIMGNDRRSDVAGEVFKHLKQMVSVGDIELAGPSRDTGRNSRFSGTGYRLGQTPDDTKVIGGPTTQRSDDRPEIHLRLWRNGFTVGDEPLRPYSNPENREAIDLLLRGEVPMSLIPPGTTDGKVNVQVEDLRHESYAWPSNRDRYFTGQGHVLGNVVPDVITNEPNPVSAPAENTQTIETPPASPLKVNEDEPITTVIIRLPNGARSQVRLNLTHTVEDLRGHLAIIHSELNDQLFAFMVNFPPKEVTDEKMTIKDAGLMNSSVYLRVKK